MCVRVCAYMYIDESLEIVQNVNLTSKNPSRVPQQKKIQILCCIQ